jgi:Phosphate transporter family
MAVFWAAFFNFVAAFLLGTGVAKTISSNLVKPDSIDIYVVFSGLIGAIAWDLITWWLALPTSGKADGAGKLGRLGREFKLGRSCGATRPCVTTWERT